MSGESPRFPRELLVDGVLVEVDGTLPIDPYDLIGAAREASQLLSVLSHDGCDAIVPTLVRLDRAIALSAPLAKPVWQPSELAAAWHVSVSTVRGWIDDGELPAFNVGRGSVPHWRITQADALRFAEARAKNRAGES